MNKITITIETGNAAFEDGPEFEVARILRNVAHSITVSGLTEENLYDLNGNRVGKLQVDRE